MIAHDLEASLHMAFVAAREQRHEFITVEHLLLTLLDNPSAAEVLHACDAKMKKLRKRLAAYIKRNTPRVKRGLEVDTNPTLGFQRVIQRAIMHVQRTGGGKKEVVGSNVLAAIFGEKQSDAVRFLHEQDIDFLRVKSIIDGKVQGDEEVSVSFIMYMTGSEKVDNIFVEEFRNLVLLLCKRHGVSFITPELALKSEGVRRFKTG